MKNAAIGIFLLALAGILALGTGIPFLEYLLREGMRLLGLGFTLGLVYGLIALLVSSPLIFWYGWTRGS
jgi:hypothetical protein